MLKKYYAVIGDPIEHSMSPVLHNTLFSHYSMNAKYERILVERGNLKLGIRQLRDKEIAGFNVTIPHKTEIMAFLDEIDHLAAKIGAVNTVVNRGGVLIGYNTDGLGYVRGLQKLVPNFKDKQILIVGAGGAARAIYFTLASVGVAKIDIVNRTPERAEQLILSCPYDVKSTPFSLFEATNITEQYDIIIQTTSIGMLPNINESPLSIQNIKKETIVSDIIYNPLQTKFLQEAERHGAITQNGVPMFVYQGALAFEKWTGIFPDTKLMEQTVIDNL